MVRLNMRAKRLSVILLCGVASLVPCGQASGQAPAAPRDVRRIRFVIELQKKYADKLQIVGLSTDEIPAALVKRFVQKQGINYRVAITTPEMDAKFGGIVALPTSFVLDTEGRVVEKHIGLNDPSLYEAEIRALLGLPVDAQVETFEDTGQVFLKNAARATELPGVDLSKLTPAQKKIALRRLNTRGCTCGCGLTLGVAEPGQTAPKSQNR